MNISVEQGNFQVAMRNNMGIGNNLAIGLPDTACTYTSPVAADYHHSALGIFN